MRAILLVILGLAVGLFSLGNSSGMGAGDQLPCTVTVQAGESIQAAIDAAEEGTVVCLAEGTWEENLVIGKGLTLRGLGPEKSVIKSVKEDEPVILISSDAEIEVTIEGLTIAEAKGWRCAEGPLRCPNGLSLGGKVKATIEGNTISGNRDGISMWGSAQATIQGNTISENGWNGISICDSAQATIEKNTISENGWNGISICDSAQATISNSQISGNETDGISMRGSAQATITNSQISGNKWDGISMWGSAQATIENNTIQEHKECGIWSSSDNPAQGKGNRMRGNGADLCGNAPASLRIPLVPPTTKTQLSFPGPYPTLQEAIDALAPGGVITIAAGEHKAGLTIWKPLTLRGAGREEVKFMGAVSLISEAQEVQIEGVTITGSAFTGLLLGGQAKATITNSQILGNKGSGIGMRDSAQATISSSQTSSNEGDGISMWGSAQAEIRASTIEGNGTSENCKKDDYICNGIELKWKPQVKIIDSTIRNNADWGVGAVLTQCGYKFDEFTGAVTFEDMMLDQIAGNNTSGNQNGMGNPGNHYWNRPDIPDGQVCLP
jgi:parallel beta-helix repeat protein